MSTFAELTAAVTTRTGNDDSTSIGRYINEARVDVLLRTKCNVTSLTITLAGTADETLDDGDVLEITEVSKVAAGGVDYLLQRVTPQEILRLRANSSDTSPSRKYAVEGLTLMLWPTPAAGDVLTYYGVPTPTVLTGSDVPSDIPLQWHKSLFYYACAEASDDRDDETASQGDRYRSYYERDLIKIRKNMNRMGGRRLPRATVGRGSSAPHDNSADWR